MAEVEADDLIFPPADLRPLLDIARFLDDHPHAGLLVAPDGNKVGLPSEVYAVVRQAVAAMRRGNAVVVAPQGPLLTTQEAADFLGVSRPTLVKLLEEGAIPFEKPNRHRRVRLHDLLEFRAQRREAQRAALDELTEEASALGLYEGSSADYATALRSARRRRGRN
jgi:excisionase family DNA binding protein